MRTIVELVERRKAVGHVCLGCVVRWSIPSVSAVCTRVDRVGLVVFVVYNNEVVVKWYPIIRQCLRVIEATPDVNLRHKRARQLI
jgi:hypothetical protein